MKVIGIEALKGGLSYVLDNPMFLLRSLVHAARLQIGVPLDALRWLAAKVPAGRGPSEIEVQAAPPGLHLSAKVNLMGNKLHIGGTLLLDRVWAEAAQFLLELRIHDLQVNAPADSPIRQMLAVMDLSKPGNLLGFMPMKLPGLVEAHDDRFVFDLLQVPKLAKNLGLRRVLAAAAEVLTIKEVRTEGDLLLIGLRVHPFGLSAALSRLQAA